MVLGEGSREPQYSTRLRLVLYCRSLDPSPRTIIPPTALLSSFNYYIVFALVDSRRDGESSEEKEIATYEESSEGKNIVTYVQIAIETR